MAVKKYNLKDLIVKDTSDIFDELKKSDLIFRSDFNMLARHFLSYVLPINTFTAGFSLLRQAYLAEGYDDSETAFISKVPSDDADFYKYICKMYLSIVKEPMGVLLAHYDQTTEDVKAIDKTLREIANDLTSIEQRNDTSEIQERKPILYYYRKHNEDAKAEILDFLFNDIKYFALNQCYDTSLFISFLSTIPYNYRWRPASYKPRPPHDLDNKFGEVSIKKIAELKEIYGTDRSEFNKFLSKYIVDSDIVFSIQNRLSYHHILHCRAEVILEALDAYNRGTKTIFSAAVPTIIEGILHDLCLQIGEKENDLLQQGFQYKLDQLRPILGYELDYEYYSFRFRLFRNKVAHGRLTNTDVDQLADLLLLDLKQMCDLVFTTKIALNQKRFLIEELSKNLGNPNYNNLIELIFLSKQEIPDFYDLSDQIKSIEPLIRDSKFWSFLDDQLEKGGETVKHGIIALVRNLRAQKSYDKRCTSILKKAGIPTPDKKLVVEYLKNMRKYY